MPTTSSVSQPWHTTSAAKSDVGDIEPDDEWKANLRKRIEEGLQSMVKEAKDGLEQEILRAPEDKPRLLAEHQEAMGNIRALAAEQFSIELARECQERRWAAGLGMNPKWTEALVQEQQTIFAQIKQTGSQNERTSNSNESPIEERTSEQIHTVPTHNPPPLPLREERDRRSTQGSFARRGSDTQSTSPRDRGDHVTSLRRPKPPVPQRAPMPDWTTHEPPEDTNGLSRSEWISSPISPGGGDPSPTKPMDRSNRMMSDRHMAHSPPNSSPVFWKPSMSPQEDTAATSKHYGLGRRGSAASMRSIGSTNSMRLPTVTDSIPERVDDTLPDLTRTIQLEQQRIEEEMQRIKEVEKEWATRDQARQRRGSRDSLADPGIQSDDIPVYSSTRSSGPFANQKGSMHSKKSLSSKTSFSREYSIPDSYDYTKVGQSKTFRSALGMDSSGVPEDRLPPHPPSRRVSVSRKTSFGEPHDTARSSKRRSNEKSFSFTDERQDFSVESPQDIRRGPYSKSGAPTPPTSASRRGAQGYDDGEFDEQLHYENYHHHRHEVDHGPRPRSDSSEFEYHKKPRAKWKQGATKPAPPSLTESDPYSGYQNPYSRHPTQPISVPRTAPIAGFDDSPWTRWGMEDHPIPFTADNRASPYTRRQDDQHPLRSANPLQSNAMLSQSPPSSFRGHRHHPANFPHRRDVTTSEEDDDDDDDGDGEDEEEDSEDDSESEDDVHPAKFTHRSRKSSDKVGWQEDYPSARVGPAKQVSGPKGKEKEFDIRGARGKSKWKGKDHAWKGTQQDQDEEKEWHRKLQEAEDRDKEEQERLKAKREWEQEQEESKRREEREREARQERERVQRDAEENERLFNEARQKAEEALRIAKEAAAKHEWAKEQEEALRRKKDEACRLQADAEMKRAEAVKLAEEVRIKEELARQKELEILRKEEEIKEREMSLQLREEESRRRDEARKEQEAKSLKEKEQMEKREKRKAEKKKEKEEKEARARSAHEERERALQEEKEKREREEREWEEREREEREEQEREEREEQEREIKRQEQEKERQRVEREQKEKEEMARKEREREEREREEIARLQREREDKERREHGEREKLERLRKEQDEAERLQKEWDRQRKRREQETAQRRQDELERGKRLDEERIKSEQQEEFRKREEEIRRRTGERKRQDSVGTESTWPNGSHSASFPTPSPSTAPKSPPTRAPSANFSSGDRSSGGSSAWTSSTGSAWSSSTSATSTSNTSAAGATRSSTATPSKPRAGSVSSGGFQSASPHSATSTPSFEAEWARRQAEQARLQQEKFRLEQERLEAQRQARAAGKPLGAEELVRLFEKNERTWSVLPSMESLRWADFPWPMIKKPSNPEDITTFAIESYILSPHYPDKSRSDKDRIRDFIKRWHPDRFETKLLAKVSDDEKEAVKEGAGSVVRSLNDLLARKNEPTNEARWND